MKRGCAIIAVAALALLCGSALPAREDAKPGPWVKFNEMDGIVAYGRDNPRGFFKQGRFVGVIDLSVAQGENMMRDWDLYQKVFYMSKKTGPVNLPGLKATNDTRYAYILQGAPWPLQDRDVVSRMDYYYHKPTNEVLVKVQAINADYPIPKDVIRIRFCEMEWMLKPIDDNHLQVTYQIMLMPGGAIDEIPPSIMNMALKYVGIFTIQNIRKLAKQEKYRRPATVITQTPWPAELRSYAEDVAKS